MKLFVTGGTGFIGSHFLARAIGEGHCVTALRRSPASTPQISLAVAPTWLDRGFADVQAAEIDPESTFVHLAAHSANVPYDTLEECLRWNVTEPLKLIRTAISVGIRRFVIAGSCFEFGRSGERYEFIPPNAPLEPTQTYPASKAAASVAFHALAVEANLSLSLHRIFQVFGPGEAESRLWPSLRRAAEAGANFPMSPGEQIRDFVPVESVAAQLLEACTAPAPDPGNPRFENIGTGKPQSLREFAEHWWSVWEATGQLEFGKLPYRDGEVMRFVPEISSHPESREEFVFVYGTLRRGGRRAVETFYPGARFVSEATIAGNIIDFGSYPGLALDPEAPPVIGEVYAIPDSTLPDLDAWEGLPGSDEYRRIRASVKLPNKSSQSCWIYEIHPDRLPLGKPIPSGDWLSPNCTSQASPHKSQTS